MIDRSLIRNKSDAKPRRITIAVNGSIYRVPVFRDLHDLEQWARTNLMPSERAEFYAAYDRAKSDIDSRDL